MRTWLGVNQKGISSEVSGDAGATVAKIVIDLDTDSADDMDLDL